MNLDFKLLRDTFSIYRLNKDSTIPDWLDESDFYSVTKTGDEMSIVCKQVDNLSDDRIKADRHWRILKINGPLNLSQVGIIAYFSDLFKKNKISIFTISTYDTDYFLIKDDYIHKAIKVLKNMGHTIIIDK